MIMWPNYFILCVSMLTSEGVQSHELSVDLPSVDAQSIVAQSTISQSTVFGPRSKRKVSSALGKGKGTKRTSAKRLAHKVAAVSKVPTPLSLAPTVLAQNKNPSKAATPPSADVIIAKVQNFYNNTQSFSAIFRQTVTNQTFNKLKPTISMGRVYILKPGKMRWDYKNKSYRSAKDPKVSKSFISDGKHLWAVMHKAKQYFKEELDGSTLPVAVSFLMGEGDLRKEFDVAFDTSGKYGSKKDVLLLLTPKVPSARYKKLWLVIDPKDYSVKQSIVLNSKGDTNAFRFTGVKTNDKSLKKGHFIFNEKANPDFRAGKRSE